MQACLGISNRRYSNQPSGSSDKPGQYRRDDTGKILTKHSMGKRKTIPEGEYK